MKVSYNWLQNYFEQKLPSPEKVSEGIIFHAFEIEEAQKVGDDTVFDIKILPDRAHDCLSHFGIAKEISAIFDLKIKDQAYKIFEPKQTKLEIKKESDKCLRYMGRTVRNIKVGASPAWLKDKLNAIGQKSINNIVDAANFIMFDLGQPIHCFDLDKLASEKIIVRDGKKGEKITTLDKKEVNLDESVLVIADEKDTLAIAGIKGGVKAEVDLNTKNIVIEVANFDATTTRKTAKHVGILTDAVKRYENEISPELCGLTMNAITDLIFKLAGGEAEDVVDIYPKKPAEKKINFSTDFVNKKLGEKISSSDIENILKKYNYSYKLDKENFEIVVPTFRLDLNIPEDMVEEIGRAYGYEKISPTAPDIKSKPKANEIFSKIISARNKLLNDGYSEVMTYVFQDKGEVGVLASASDKKLLRKNLADGLKESLKLNQVNAPLLSMDNIKIFEIGTVFKKGGEEMHVAYGDKKEIKEMTLEEFSAGLEKEDFSISKFDFSGKHFTPWSPFPFIARDIAVWVPEDVPSSEVEKIIKNNINENVIKGPELFDEFKKDGKISYAFRLVFQSSERTLTDAEVNTVMTEIGNKIKEKNAWQVR